MKGLGRLCLVLLCPGLAFADPLPVQTGEHDSFTRVVIGVPRDVDWQLGRNAEGYLLRLPTEDGFVLDQFYDLIPRDRIVEVSQDSEAGELRLRVDCQCHAQAVIYQSEYLVIDVRDGPAPPDSPFELSLVADIPTTLQIETPLPVAPTFPIARNPVLPLITPRIGSDDTAVTSPEVAETIALPETTKEEALPSQDSAQDTEAALQMIAQALGESLGRGLSDGLLQGGIEEGGTSAAVDGSFIPDGTPLPGLNARTSVDPLAVSSAVPEPQTQVGQTCLPDDSFDIGSWGDDSPPHAQLRQARGAMVTPADQFQEDALLNLARLYVYLGFGHEARQTLDLEGVQSRDRILLRAIAKMIDGEPVAPDLFSGQVSCPSHVALWALLAQLQAPVDAQVDRAAVITAYRALPTYVQQPIAPRLTEALLAIGAEDIAMQVIGREADPAGEDLALALADAALSDALGEEDAAIEKVTELARNDRRTNPEAMVRFFTEGAASGVTFSDEDFLLADALRFEHAESPAAAALYDAQFDAYLSVDRFADARALLRQRIDDTPLQDEALQRRQMLQEATERLSDAAFLEFVWSEDLTQEGVETQNAVGARLLALDFPTQALAVLTGSGSGPAAAVQESLREEAMRQATLQQPLPDPNFGTTQTAGLPQPSDLRVSGNAVLDNSRALVESAEQSRETIRALLEAVPAPADF